MTSWYLSPSYILRSGLDLEFFFFLTFIPPLLSSAPAHVIVSAADYVVCFLCVGFQILTVVWVYFWHGVPKRQIIKEESDCISVCRLVTEGQGGGRV